MGVLDEETLRAVVAELAPIVGARIQRVDVVAEREFVLELRLLGRTLRLLVSARPGVGRVHLVEARPAREVSGGDLQRVLRKRLEGRPLVLVGVDRRTVIIDAKDHRLEVRTDGGPNAFTWTPPGEGPIPAVPEPERVPASFPISERIAARYTGISVEANERLRREIAKRLDAKRKKLERLIRNVAADRQRLASMSEARRMGELLKTALHQVERGATSVRVIDFVTGESVEVPLDPGVSAKRNLERFFARAKKAERGLPVVDARLRAIEGEMAELARRRARVDSAEASELAELAPSNVTSGDRATARAEAESKKKPIDRWARRFEAVDGTEIRVGRGAKENDRLTLSFARGDDIWLHASGAAGAHVLLRMQKGAKPNPEALLDAAHLAAHYSGSKNAAKVEVIFTEARHVRKTKGDPPGRVSVAKPRTLLVTLDPARLERLFGRAGLSPSTSGT